jgi:peptidoglycan/LPS O-acetylase OafA/YrhL
MDGIRAVAYLAVITYHTGMVWSQWTWGWLGVDVFFALSGYLITGLLLAEHARTGTVRLGRFWARRAARLTPPLTVTVAATAVLVRAGIDPWQGTDRATILAAATYLMDWWRAVGHGGGSLAHTWSLGIEEQFYLCWPLALVAFRGRRAALTAAAAGGIASAAYMLHRGMWDFGYIAYDSPLARVWELLAGCVLAAAVHHRTGPARPGRAAVWAGAALIGAAACHADGQPGKAPGDAALAVLGTVLVLAGSTSGALPVRILAWPPLAWIGRRTYGMYAYHYPIVGVLLFTAGMPPEKALPVAVCATLALAAVSYRWVETPITRTVRAWTAPQTTEAAPPPPPEEGERGAVPFPDWTHASRDPRIPVRGVRSRSAAARHPGQPARRSPERAAPHA